MAKGDQQKGQQAINTQGPLAQNYLSSQQGQVGQTTGNLSNMYFGGGGGPSGGKNISNVSDLEAAGQMAQNYARTLGAPSDANLAKVVDYMRSQGYNVEANPGSDGFFINGPLGRIGVDMIRGYKGGDPKNQAWQWLHQFNDTGGGGGAGGVMGMNLGDYKNIMGRYQNFADTGGYSKEDLANIRARSISPTRGIYSNMEQNLQRQRALQGGYSPNYTAASAKLAREGSQQIADINRSTEADIAQMVHQGKLAGMGGMAGMYGATPGLSDMFGRQVLASQGQGLEAAGLQNQLGLGRIAAQQANARIPGNWQQAMNNVGSGFDIAGRIGDAIYPWLE